MATPKLNQIMLAFETHTGLGVDDAALLLGMAAITYRKSRYMERPLKLYHERHIEALMLMRPVDLKQLIERHVYGNRT